MMNNVTTYWFSGDILLRGEAILYPNDERVMSGMINDGSIVFDVQTTGNTCIQYKGKEYRCSKDIPKTLLGLLASKKNWYGCSYDDDTPYVIECQWWTIVIINKDSNEKKSIAMNCNPSDFSSIEELEKFILEKIQ